MRAPGQERVQAALGTPREITAQIGRTVYVGEIVIFRIVDGKIIEAWEEYDEHGMRRQLAVADQPASAATQP
jgi:hypothetical protein